METAAAYQVLCRCQRFRYRGDLISIAIRPTRCTVLVGLTQSRDVILFIYRLTKMVKLIRQIDPRINRAGQSCGVGAVIQYIVLV